MPVEIITKSSADVITDIFRTFGDESGTQITSADIIRWINRSQMEIAMRNPEIGSSVALTNSVAGQADYGLLASVPTVLTIQSVHYSNRPLSHMPFQEAEAFLMDPDNATSATPLYWFERGGVVTLFPTPDVSVTNGIKFYYNKRPADITTSSQLLSVSDHYYNSVVAFCLEQAYLLDENPTLAGAVAQKFEAGVTQMRERTETQSDFYPFITQSDDDY